MSQQVAIITQTTHWTMTVRKCSTKESWRREM